MKPRRLFLFAAYDPTGGVVDDALIMYVRALSEIGDVVLHMDNDAPKSELKKLQPYTLHAGAAKHGEYDFGSYKRAYIWARDNGILENYDWVYIVNDSMYGPLKPLEPILQEIECKKTDVVGIMYNCRKKRPHIQSWFVGFSQKTIQSPILQSFILGVEKQPTKGAVCRKYETGLTVLLNENGFSWACKYNYPRGIYGKIRWLFNLGLPFFKKASFTHKRGAMGRQTLYILNHISPDARRAILENAIRVHGEKHVRWVLTNNPFKILFRKLNHTRIKLFIEGI